ncbi:phosphoribosylglycinamide formyltransferase [Muribaculaceae bacterium]|nr:phosphoribosylglycinamide formyltransferase [Lachnospiraceae bacterium]GFI59071.1 phosphoribosylglycinamide formyltransferase [Muribaculaceae bacterium]
MNYAFYISGKSSRLIQYLSQFYEQKNLEIKLVVSDSILEKELESILNQFNIPSRIFEYKKLLGKTYKEKNRTLSDRIMYELDAHKIDYCLSFGSHILSGVLLDKYKNRLINFHPAILPMYPGKNAIDQAVCAENTFLVGNTVHFIDEGVDTGKIIMQSVIPLESFFSNNNDYDAILNLQIEMLDKLLLILEEDRVQIQDGRVKIIGADYNKSNLYPFI